LPLLRVITHAKTAWKDKQIITGKVIDFTPAVDYAIAENKEWHVYE
jgi:hypothetical protein